ncbi:MAG: hypothetical protein [Caudoviricetes sp.]|nr:MAG: hypothetical protein [Caudoviricetes sp.]
MATISRIGFGQVEPNHLSAQRTGQIYAQLPAEASIEQLENGQFVKYDYAKGVVDFTGEGEWMMVFNEVKLYDGWRESYKDFAMIKDNYTPGSDNITHDGLGPFPGQMTPRVIKTNVGDIYTTNAVGGPNTSRKAEYAGIELVVGDTLSPQASDGFLVKGGTPAEGDPVFQVVKVYTMPDGQPAVKLMRIK